MVEINARRLHPRAFLDLSRLSELRARQHGDGRLVLGAGVTYSEIIAHLGRHTALVAASRTVGSPQIRHRGTLGGNLATASPAGDLLPPLAAYDAEVLLASARGRRSLLVSDFLLGPKRTALREDELIVGVRWRIVRQVSSFSKIGPRNAIALAVASLALVIDEDRRQVRAALGSAGPTVLRAPEAEAFAVAAMTGAGAWEDTAVPLLRSTFQEFGDLVAAAARPIDDVRGSAAYRREAARVLARRALAWAMAERRSASTHDSRAQGASPC